MTLEQFLYMGGYGDYVWGSYALAFIILAANVIVAVLNKRQTIKMIKIMLEKDAHDT
jgi:heme exporter protein D